MTTQMIFYAAATIAGFATCALHAFAGGAIMARPFYQQAAAGGISTHAFRYCWHFVTLALFATGAGFAFLTLQPQHAFFGVYLTANAFGFSALSFLVSNIEGAPPFKSPPAILGAIIGALGLAALAVG